MVFHQTPTVNFYERLLVRLRKSNTLLLNIMELYHLLNRGVEKRDIFLDTYDRDRFVFGLEIFNDNRRIDNVHRLVNGSEVLFMNT